MPNLSKDLQKLRATLQKHIARDCDSLAHTLSRTFRNHPDPRSVFAAYLAHPDFAPKLRSTQREALFLTAHSPNTSFNTTPSFGFSHSNPALLSLSTHYTQSQRSHTRELAFYALCQQPWNETTQRWLQTHLQHDEPSLRIVAASTLAAFALRGLPVRDIVETAYEREDDTQVLAILAEAHQNTQKDPFRQFWSNPKSLNSYGPSGFFWGALTPKGHSERLSKDAYRNQPNDPRWFLNPSYPSTLYPLHQARFYALILSRYTRLRKQQSFIRATQTTLPSIWERALRSFFKYVIQTSPQKLTYRFIVTRNVNLNAYVDLYSAVAPPLRTGSPWSSIHHHLLNNTSKGISTAAAQFLQPEHRELAHSLLSYTTLLQRTHGARFCRLYPHQDSIQPLQDALSTERSKSLPPLLQEALHACETSHLPTLDTHFQHGTYNPKHPFSQREALAQLRELLNTDAIEPTWMQICDLIQRAHLNHQDTSPLIDYLQHHTLPDGLTLPSETICPLWGDAALQALGTPMHTVQLPTRSRDAAPILKTFDLPTNLKSMPHLLPVSAFLMHDNPHTLLSSTLKAIQGRTRSRHIDPDHLPTLRAAIVRGWAWCVEHHLSPKHLEIRIDGGVKRGLATPDTTRIELWHGFGLVVSRNSAAYKGQTLPGGLRHFRVWLPKDHILRDQYNLPNKEPTLDLIPHISLL